MVGQKTIQSQFYYIAKKKIKERSNVNARPTF